MNIVVTVDKGHLKNITRIARALEALGVSVQQVMKIGGIITGSVKESKRDLEQLKIQGVKSIETSRTVKAL
jgi:hypothetical protein